MNSKVNRALSIALLFVVAITNCAHNQIVHYSLKNSTTRIGIVQGDITKQRGIDVIVNAANEQLRHGGGVAAAISKAAGPGLQIHCNKLPIAETWGCPRCPTGYAVITPAFNLNAIGIKGIIHAVGPRIAPRKLPTPVDEKLLYKAYTNSLKIAARNKMRSIAFPSISTAIFGYDINYAAPVAIRAVYDFIKYNPHAFDEVRFVLFSGHDFGLYNHMMTRFLSKKAHKPKVRMPNKADKLVIHVQGNGTVNPVVELTWSQWAGEHPYMMVGGAFGFIGFMWGMYSIFQ
jgi:O-acetyl-ADP-ribose deacetylase (regulator of RNase III)